jgi:preprotein translocase YajC subunit
MTSLQLMMQLIVFSTVALGIVYFLFYRPTVEAQRKARRVISDLQVGDEVVTTSGFFGRIIDVSEPDDGPAVVSLDLGGATVRARVTAIAELLPRPKSVPAEQNSQHDDRRGVPAPPQPVKGRQV